MRTMKKTVVLLVLVITCALFGKGFADTVNQHSPLAVDLIVVMEHSWGVKNGKTASDPSGYRYDAAAALINMCDAKYSRANYLLFNEKFYSFINGKTETINKDALSLFDISMALGRSNRFEMLNELTAPNKAHNLKTSGGADIGTALLAAVDTQIQDSSKNKKVIFILVDGESSFPKDNRTKFQIQKLLDESKKNITIARKKAEDNGITINAILLRDKTALSFIQSELCTSDGEFTFVSDAEQLPGSMMKMLSDNVGTTILAANGSGGKSSEIQIPVPNSFVSEMNIMIPLSNIESSSLQLMSPEGNLIDENENNQYSTISPYFAFYKVISPEQGNWRIIYNGNESNSNITVQFVLEYDLLPFVSLSTSKAGKNEPVVISSHFEKNGIPVHDEYLYQIPAQIMLMKDERVIRTERVEGTTDGYKYTFDSLKDIGAGEYSIVMQYDGEGLVRKTIPKELTILNMAPELKQGVSNKESYTFTIDTPGKEESYNVQTKEWDLNQMVTDPDGDSLTWVITSAPDGIVASIRDSVLSVSTIKNTTAEGDVVVACSDSDGEKGPSITYHIKVVSDTDSLDTIIYGPTAAITKSNDTATIKVQYVIDGMTLTVGDYYKIPAMLTLKKNNNILLSGVPLVYDGSAYIYTFTDLKKYGPGQFEVNVRLYSGSFSMDCAPFSFNLVNKKPIIKSDMPAEIDCLFRINNPEDQSSYEVQHETYDLSSYAYDPDGDSLTWHIESNNADIKATLSGSVLSISTIKDKETIGDVVVAATDSDDDTGAKLTFHVSVSSVENELKIAVTGPIKPVRKDEPISFSAQLLQNEKSIAKDSRMNLIPATIAIRKDDDVIYSALAMDCEDGIYSCTITDLLKYGAGEYSAIIKLQSGYFSISSEPLEFVLSNDAPKLIDPRVDSVKHEFEINIPGDIASYQSMQWTVDLNEFVDDPNGDEISWEIKNNTADVDVLIEKNILTISTRKNTASDGIISILPVDSDGDNGPEINVSITVVSIEDVYNQYTAEFLPISTTEKNSDIPLELYVYNEKGDRVENDSYLPEEITATVNCQNDNETIILKKEDKGSYNGSFHSGKISEEYLVSAEVAVGEKSIKSKPLAFATNNRIPVCVRDLGETIPKTILIGFGSDKDIKLDDFFSDPDDDALDYIIVDNNIGEHADIFTENQILKIRPKSGAFCFPITGKFAVRAIDTEGAEVDSAIIEITIWPVLLMLLTVIIFIAIIIALVKFMTWKKACFSDAAFEVSYGYMGLELPDELSKAFIPGGHMTVTLDDYCTEQAGKVTGEIITKDIMKAITLKPLSKGRIQIITSENAKMIPYEDRPTYLNGQYSASKPIKKSHILKSDESFYLYSDKCYLRFELVRIIRRQ